MPRLLISNNLNSIAALVAAGAGIGALPVAWGERLASRGVAVQLDSESDLPTLEYTFQRRRDDTRPLVASYSCVTTLSVNGTSTVGTRFKIVLRLLRVYTWPEPAVSQRNV